MPENKITGCMVVLNRLQETQRAIKRAAPYFTKICVVDGQSTDGTLEWLQSEEAKNLGVEVKVSKQHRFKIGNHTPKERNQYLEMAGNDGWLVYFDSDEYIEQDGLESLDRLIESAERNGFNGIAFNSHDVWPHENGEVYDQLSNYWNPSMSKSAPGQHYVGHTHSGLHRPGIQPRYMKSGFVYKHVKTERRMWKNSTYLYWTTAGIAQNITDDAVWQNFHNVMEKYGHHDWHEFDKHMTAGNLPQEIKDLFVSLKDGRTSEERAWFVWYFIFLHPEENIDKLSNQDRSWDYVEKCREQREVKGIPESVVSLEGDLAWLEEKGII